jgi:hypothetical protein
MRAAVSSWTTAGVAGERAMVVYRVLFKDRLKKAE